jgi:hypothetical protein
MPASESGNLDSAHVGDRLPGEVYVSYKLRIVILAYTDGGKLRDKWFPFKHRILEQI